VPASHSQDILGGALCTVLRKSCDCIDQSHSVGRFTVSLAVVYLAVTYNTFLYCWWCFLRNLLFDLLKACSGNPSPKLVARILEESKAKERAKTQEVEMFSRLNFFGQSSNQIRARAGATILAIRHVDQDNNPNPDAGSIGVSTMKDDASEDGTGAVRRRPTGFPRLSERKPRSSVLKSLDSMHEEAGSDSDDDMSLSTASSSTSSRSRSSIYTNLKPSQIVQISRLTKAKSLDGGSGNDKPIPPSLQAITEDGDEDEDEDEDALLVDGDTEKERKESIRRYVQARFSGVGQSPESRPSLNRASSAPSPETQPSQLLLPLPQPQPFQSTALSRSRQATMVSVDVTRARRRTSSKRLSCMNVHPALLETICHEFMASVPWHVSGATQMDICYCLLHMSLIVLVPIL
jgi:hypothetical protein